MQSSICKDCKHCAWMVGIGMGVRCKHTNNQKFKKEEDSHKNLPVIISHVPDGCEYYQKASL